MTIESIRAFCKTLAYVAEDVKWGDNLCFLIGGKMFAITCLDQTAAHKLSFKCTPEKFIDLVEVQGVVQAPYMARNHWVALERFDALRDAEIKELVSESYVMVKGKLPRSVQLELEKGAAKSVAKTRSKKAKSNQRK